MRYPIDALEHKLGTFLYVSKDGQPARNEGLSRVLGIAPGTIARQRQTGLRVREADLYAVRAGYHPALVWPSWFDDAMDESRDLERLAEWWARLGRYREQSVELAA